MIWERALIRTLNESAAMPIDHPRRITPPSPPGALLKRASESQPRIASSSAGRDDPDYLAMVRQCPCLKCGMEPSEAAHVRMSSAAYGKASGAQHNRGECEFWHSLGINPLLTADKLYAQRGDQVAMFAVIFTTIAQRGIT